LLRSPLRANAKSANAQRRSLDMDMDIKRNGSRPSAKGSPDWFTGSVRVDPLFQAPDPARVGGGQLTFEPGARTAWHTHPLGQTLIITAGLGWVQRDGGPERPDALEHLVCECHHKEILPCIAESRARDHSGSLIIGQKSDFED
jgi:hypothetical protein